MPVPETGPVSTGYAPIIEAAHAREPAADCALCPRLVAHREADCTPDSAGRDGPVPSVGSRNAPLLIVSLAPGRQAARDAFRPFADEHAASLLYEALHTAGLAETPAPPAVHDFPEQTLYRIVCTTRCRSPENLPQPSEIVACNQFLKSELQTMPNLRVVLALGVLAHNATVAACGIPFSRTGFHPGEITSLPDGLRIADSHHLSRHNIESGIVTRKTFRHLVSKISEEIR
nr:uracil-DNA glycosylase family protein [Acetobacter musti]